MLLAQRVQRRDAPGILVAREQQREQRHEVRLARAERAEQVGDLAFAIAQRGADDRQRPIECIDQRGRDDVRRGGRFRILDALGELEHERALAEVLGQLEQILDASQRGHFRVLPTSKDTFDLPKDKPSPVL